MKAVSNNYKKNIKELGREIAVEIKYTAGSELVTLDNDHVYSMSIHYEGDILKSVMKQLDLELDQDIPLGTILEARFGVKINDAFNNPLDINYGNFIVYSSEKLEDTGNYKLVCYDKMLYAMKDYETPVINLLNINDWESGWIAPNGNYFSDDKYVYFDLIPVEGNKNYTINANADIYSMWVVEYYDLPVTGNYHTIKGTYINNNQEKVYDNNSSLINQTKHEDMSSLTITTNASTKYIRISLNYNNTSIMTQSIIDDLALICELSFPMTIRDYTNILCNYLGLTFKNENDNFVNYNQIINNEKYLDSDGNSLNYTFRDVFDELAQVTASTICINDNDQLELRYPNDTINSLTDSKEYHRYVDSGGVLRTPSGTRYLGIYNYIECEAETQYTVTFEHNNSGANLYVGYKDANGNFLNRTNYRSSRTFTTPEGAKTMFMYLDASSITFPDIGGYVMLNEGNTAIPYGLYTINEEYLKDINVNFGEVYGPINTITFKRSADSDIVTLSEPTDLADDLKNEIVISDNQILNDSSRADFLQGILTQLYGLTYSINDFSSTGITFLDLCDKYNISITKEDEEGTSTTSTYQCIMLNDEINITQGLEELIRTEAPEESTTDYNTSARDDRTALRTELIVNKQEGYIQGVVQGQSALEGRMDTAEAKLTAQGLTIDVKTSKIDDNGNATSFETDGAVYELTSDATFQEGKNYYIKINSQEYQLATVTVGDTVPSNTYYESSIDNLIHYEMNANGFLTEDKNTGFKAYRTAEGDYYYDNTTMIGKYTKEGSVQKDMALFGKYYYGVDENVNVETFNKDDARFMATMYIASNGQQGFGHFWNRD